VTGSLLTFRYMATFRSTRSRTASLSWRWPLTDSGGDGLYLLDEPEAALSVTGALALLAIVTRAANSGAQFVIATHSPVLLAAPGAQIYELDEEGINSAVYDDLEGVRQMRGFLDAPDRYLRQIMIDSEAGDG